MKRYRIFINLLVIFLTLNVFKVQAQLPKIDENESLKSSKLLVGVAGEPPSVIKLNNEHDKDEEAVTGIAVETWKRLARKLKLDYELIYHDSVSEVLETLEKQEIDVAIGNISITDERINRFDFTQSISHSPLTILVPSKSPSLWSVIKPFLGWAFLSSVTLIILCLFIVGNLLWLVEHRHNSEQFSASYLQGVSEGMWCALATFTTVGYGDRYPITHVGRIVLGIWMLISLAFVTTLTAGIVNTFAVAFSSQPYEKIPHKNDLKGIRLAAIEDSAALQWAKYYRARVVPIKHLDNAVPLLESNQVDGVIYSRLILELYLHENPHAPYQLVPFDIGVQHYGFALNHHNPLTRQLNEKILSINMQLEFQELVENWHKLNIPKTEN